MSESPTRSREYTPDQQAAIADAERIVRSSYQTIAHPDGWIDAALSDQRVEEATTDAHNHAVSHEPLTSKQFIEFIGKYASAATDLRRYHLESNIQLDD